VPADIRKFPVGSTLRPFSRSADREGSSGHRRSASHRTSQLCAGRPQVGLIPRENRASRVINESRGGVAIDPRSPDDFVDAIGQSIPVSSTRRLGRKWQRSPRGALIDPNEIDRAEYRPAGLAQLRISRTGYCSSLRTHPTT
jgi:hypothetical protein